LIEPAGCEWVIEASGCDAVALRDQTRLEALFTALIEGMSLQPVGPACWHRFPGPGGITGFCMLEESHLACHTFPEHGTLCLNVFCCRSRPAWRFEAALREGFSAQSVRVRRLERRFRQS
jgi:S-adenosylmethionine decarboxylase